MKLQIIDATDSNLWDNFVTSHPESNFLHSWAWGEFHLSRGKQIVRRLAISGDKIISAYTGVVETARRGRHLAIAGGPIMDWTDKSLVKLVFKDIAEQGTANNCSFVRIRPQLEKTPQNEKLFTSLGLKPAPMYLSVELAGVLDLTKSEEEILTGMRQRLRRALRKAEKANIVVETTTDPSAIHEFYKIQLETAKRHEFISFSEDFLQKQFAAFATHGQAVLYTASVGEEQDLALPSDLNSRANTPAGGYLPGEESREKVSNPVLPQSRQVLAQNFMIFFGQEASYHYGVSTELGTKLSGAPLLHMQAMRDARARGITRYNFWGIVDENDTNHRFYGVSTFKRGFGVAELRYLPAHDLVLKPALYRLTKLIETARRRHRHV